MRVNWEDAKKINKVGDLKKNRVEICGYCGRRTDVFQGDSHKL